MFSVVHSSCQLQLCVLPRWLQERVWWQEVEFKNGWSGEIIMHGLESKQAFKCVSNCSFKIRIHLQLGGCGCEFKLYYICWIRHVHSII